MVGHAGAGTGRTLRRAATLLLAGGVVLVSTACAHKRVSRIEPAAVTDLSGRWNDTDSRLVAGALIEQSLDDPWAERHAAVAGGERPTVIVGDFRNRTLEHIPVNTFLNDLESALLRSGSVRVVARPGSEREEIRTERDDQQVYARSDTRARPAREHGADYMLQGEILALEDEEGRERVVYYQVDATLIDLESNLKVWAGTYRIKKLIERRRFGL